MALKDLIATPGEAAAARITKKYRFTGEAQEQLRMQIQYAVDSAVEAERAACAAVAETGFGDVEIRDAILSRKTAS